MPLIPNSWRIGKYWAGGREGREEEIGEGRGKGGEGLGSGGGKG